VEPSSPAADGHDPSAADRPQTRDAKGSIVEIAIDGVTIGPAVAFPPSPHPASDEVGWTTETDELDGW